MKYFAPLLYQACSQDFQNGGYMGVDVHVCMHKHARLGQSEAMFPQEILEMRCSEITSKAILEQKQSRSSYMARGVLHIIFDCERMHLLTGGVTSLGRQLQLN